MLSSFKLRLIKILKVTNELVILSISSQHNNFFFFFLEVNNRIPLTQVEMVLTTPNTALIGISTKVNVVPVVEIPLITPAELAPVDACSNFYCKHFYISVSFYHICS